VAGAPMAVLNDAFGFGGHNVALAFTEYQPEQA
jgi:3-oxoacyl-(acyl-carrier-protein) synthase